MKVLQRKGDKVLFLTWDGPDVNYLENLFAPIFSKLHRDYEYEFHIVQFIWANPLKLEKRKKLLQERGIFYSAIKLSGKSSVFDLLWVKFWHIRKLHRYVRKHRIGVIMPRAVTSLFLAKSLVKKYRLKLVWDVDGFPLDERVDFDGLSPLGFRYRFFRDQEFLGFYLAHSLICRSVRAKEVIAARAGAGFQVSKVFVVNNGIFEPLEVNNANPKPTGYNSNMLVYVGSVGPQYRMGDVLSVFRMVLKGIPEVRLSLLTYQVGEVHRLVEKHFSDLKPYLIIKTVEAAEIMQELGTASIGFSFRQQTFSMRGVAPIKVAEYLSAGLSIIYTPGTGDLDDVLEGQPFAFPLPDVDTVDRRCLIDWVCRQLGGQNGTVVKRFAENQFSLQQTADVYHQALQYAQG